MCGIAGILNLDGAPATSGDLRQMSDAIAHRGPDGEGCYADGAIALGHPVGVSGLRLAMTALFELKRRDAERAMVSACVGGGQGVAMIVERK